MANKTELKSLIRLCTKEELEDILALQHKVYDLIPQKNTFVLTTEEELAESLELDICIGAYHNGVLVGFTLMVVNPDSSRNLGMYLEYSRERRRRCVTYDTTFIDQAYRGRGLQRMLICLKDKYAKSIGAVEALATVSPDNGASLNNLKISGFEVVDRKMMYGGFDRFILRKSLMGDKA